MPHLPENARLWRERAEIDYIGPFVKSWAAFNAWFRSASSSRKDAEGLRYVKQQLNPVRSATMPWLRAAQREGGGGALIPDSEAAQQFKLLVRHLHVCLDRFHLEVSRDDVLERISFRAVCLSTGVNLPKKTDAYGLEYIVDRQNRKWKATVRSLGNVSDVRAYIEHDVYDAQALQAHAQFIGLSVVQRSKLLGLYNECNPRPFTDLLGGSNPPIIAGDIEFRCTDEQLFSGIIEIIYSMRNALLHGELQPHEQAFEAYEPAYRIVMRFLDSMRS